MAKVPAGADLRQQPWIISGAVKSKYDNYFFRISGGQEKVRTRFIAINADCQNVDVRVHVCERGRSGPWVC